MTSTTEQKLGKLIHVARIFADDGEWRYLFLRKTVEGHFAWFEDDGKQDKETEVSGPTIEEAIRLGVRQWKQKYFCMVNCGFRYTLPERDEHGMNALFHQMVLSYSSMNGIYYDDELGNNCYVQNASDESYRLWQKLKSQHRL